MFSNRENAWNVLQVIMEKQDLKVIDQIIQKDYKNLQGRFAIWTVLPEIPKANSLTWRSSRIMKVHHLRGHVTIVVDGHEHFKSGSGF